MTDASALPTIQVLMTGKTEAGKTAILRRLVNNKFYDSISSTAGVDFFTKSYNNDSSHSIKMKIYDCSGKQEYLPLIQPYYAKSKAAIICVSPTEDITFELKQQIEDLKNANPNIIIKIVSTKADLLENIDEKEQAQLMENINNLKLFAKNHGYVFHQVSAKTSSGIEELFQNIAAMEVKSTIATSASKTQPLIEDNFIDDSLSELTKKIEHLNQNTKEARAFRQALLQLTHVLEQKNRFTHAHMINTIVLETDKLINSIPRVYNEATVKKTFKNYLNNCPTQSASLLSKLIKTVVITGIFMIVGAALAAGICLSLGLGLAVGSGIVASAGATGLLGGCIAFFRKNDIEKALDTVVKTGKDAYNNSDEPDVCKRNTITNTI